MDDLFDISDRPALVTGASSGLGEHFAKLLAARGAPVIVAARRLDRLEQLAAGIVDAGGRAVAVALDVTDSASIEAGVTAAVEAFGPLQIVVNNSGVASPGRATDITESDWDFVVDTNLKGAWFVAQKAAQSMIAAKSSGSIINIQSILSFRVQPGLMSYAASKAGLVQVTRTAAIEWARYGIRVNGIAPGYIETDINREFFQTEAGQRLIENVPQKVLGSPEDLDGALLLLASDASRFMTGSTITVDGGHVTNSL